MLIMKYRMVKGTVAPPKCLLQVATHEKRLIYSDRTISTFGLSIY